MVEEDTKRKRVVVESLGWLTESSIMPKKHRAIEGVGASSILELKAELYRSQEESRKSRDGAGPDINFHRAKDRISIVDPFSLKNAGVDARAQKDKLELKAVNDGSASRAALEKKAELYDKLRRGEVSDEEDNEKYCVDFFRKSLVEDEPHEPEAHDSYPAAPCGNDDAEGTGFAELNVKHVGLGRTAGTRDHDEHKRFVREVHEEVNKAREKTSELKLRRHEEAIARREKLRLAYLRARVDKLRSASKDDHT